MEIPNQKNKMVEVSENKADAATTIKAVSVLTNEYFFPGGGKWKPMSVVAASLSEAESIHKERREPLNPGAEAKVESETNNA